MVHIFRHDRAIAQYVPGHLARLKEIDHRLTALPGLYLTGSSYRGISVNACVKEAEEVADNVMKDLADRSDRTPSEAVS
jgi:oxygen-dependent protoporphyrinogen oxidase